MGSHWAIDLGTTNTGVARWDAEHGRPRLLELPEICRQPEGEDPLQAPRLVPSGTHLVDDLDMWAQIGRIPFVANRWFVGTQAWIGRPALERNQTRVHPAFAPTFKPWLGRASLRPLARARGQAWSAREVARVFLRELLAHVRKSTGERIRECVITAPVDSYEAYRAEVREIATALGIRKVRFADEPVAAAVGYGLGLDRTRRVLVVDFGGGTLDLALVELDPRSVEQGTSRVLAKSGRPVGGDLVDQWLLEWICSELDYTLPDPGRDPSEAFWYRLMLAEARSVKEQVFFRKTAGFLLSLPEEMRSFEARMRGDDPYLDISQDDVRDVLDSRGLYRTLDACLGEVLEQASSEGLGRDDIDDVLMVGGSTLLPGVYPLFEEQFGRGRVRAWQPFEAVAFGACALAAEDFHHSDFIVHDYAFVTYDATTKDKQYTTIIPAGTRFPTKADFWRRQLVPTCALGEPETMFKLVICEIGRARRDERRFAWDDAGSLHKLGGTGGQQSLVVPLNESHPALGYLNPPHQPGDRKPRLEISFSVNADRWLCATVKDLRTSRMLMEGESVVRLM